MKPPIYKLITIFSIFLAVTALASCSKKESTDSDNMNQIESASDNANVVANSTSEEISNNDVTDNSISGQDVVADNIITSSNISSANNSSPKNSKPKKRIIAIDAGHQSKGNYDVEPIGPGSKITKPKVSSGTQGRYTGVAEYELNLAIAKKVEKELIKRGYEVVMIRETNDVNLSNKKRAEIANKSGADLFIRIHADGSEDSSVHGVSTLYPSKKNPYVPKLSSSSYSLSKAIVNAICKATGAKNRGAIARDDMSGINWCTIPVTIIEMGYMTNKTEDKLMQTKAYQNKLTKGICDGIDNYFK